MPAATPSRPKASSAPISSLASSSLATSSPLGLPASSLATPIRPSAPSTPRLDQRRASRSASHRFTPLARRPAPRPPSAARQLSLDELSQRTPPLPPAPFEDEDRDPFSLSGYNNAAGPSSPPSLRANRNNSLHAFESSEGSQWSDGSEHSEGTRPASEAPTTPEADDAPVQAQALPPPPPLPAVPLRREDVYRWLEDDALEADEKLARRIAYVLAVGPVACPADKHATWARLHDTHCTPHRALAETFNSPATGFTTLSRSEANPYKMQIGLRGLARPLGHATLRLTREDLPAAERLRARFCGWPRDSSLAGAEVCVHVDDRPREPMRAAVHDVDSFLHLTRDPHDFAGPLRICLSPQPASLLDKSIHLSVPVTVVVTENGQPRQTTRQVPLHRIPHLVLGRHGKNVLYMFFPRMYTEGEDGPKKKSTPHLTHEHHRWFFEGLLQPSFARVGPAFYQHVHHHNFSAVLAAARAATEATGAPSGRGTCIDVTFKAENLPVLWNTMRDALDAAERDPASQLWRFGEPVFLYDCKNIKLETQNAQPPGSQTGSTAADALDAFWGATTVIARSGLTSPTPQASGSPWPRPQDRVAAHATRWPQEGRQQFLDLAAEFLPAAQGHTALARRCCQYNTFLFLTGQTRQALFGERDAAQEAAAAGRRTRPPGAEDEENDHGVFYEPPHAAEGENDATAPWSPPKIQRVHVTEYPIHLLRDAVSLTGEPRKTSPLRRGGVAYMQSYTVEEGRYNVAGIWSFSHANLCNLGHSDAVWQALARVAKISPDRTPAHDALRSSCHRLSNDLDDETRGFGWRFELRVTTQLAERVAEAEAAWAELVRGDGPPRLGYLAGQPYEPNVPAATNIRADRNSFYILEASIFNRFVRKNIQKHVQLLDYITIHYAHGETTQAAAALYALTVLMLQQFISYRHDGAHAALLAAPSAPNPMAPERRVGLDIHNTIQTKGFGFLPLDAVDWHTFQLDASLASRICIPQLRIKTHRQAEATAQQGLHLLDQVLQLTLEVACDPRRRSSAEELLSILAQLVLNQYKADVYHALARRRPTEADLAGLAFTLEGLDALTRRIDGRACTLPRNNNARLQDVAQYVQWAFTQVPGHGSVSPKRIQAQQYFLMAQKIKTCLNGASRTHATWDRFLVILYYRFCQQIGCFPSPEWTSGLLAGTNKKLRGEQKPSRMVFCTAHLHSPHEVPERATLNNHVADLISSQAMASQARPPQSSPYTVAVLSDIAAIRQRAGLTSL